MAFLDIFKKRMGLGSPVGFAGGTLDDQIARQQALDNPDDQTLQNPIIRPRVNPSLPQPATPDVVDPTAPQPAAASPTAALGEAPSAPVWNPIVRKPSGEPEISKTAKGDPLDIAERQYNALQGWQPTGGKRGLKNTLKAALMYGAESVRNNPEHPVEALLAGLGTGAVAGTAVPNFKNRLVRQWKLGQAGADLQNQLGIAKEKAQVGDIQSQSQQRQMEPLIQAAKMQQLGDYRNKRLDIEQQKADGVITKIEAERKQRELDRKFKADQSDLDRKSRERVAGMRGGAAAVDNDALDENIRAAQEQQAKIDEGLKKQEDYLKTLSPTQPGGAYGDPQPNPVYEDAKKDYDKALAERNKLDEQIRGFRAKKKVPRPVQGGAMQGDTRKGTISQPQQQLWLSHNPGKTLDDMKQLYPNATMQ